MDALTGSDWGQLAYLVLLLTLVGSYFVVSRRNLNRMLQQAAIWALIFLGTLAAVGLWDDIRGTVLPQQSVFADQGRITVPRAPDGHYYLTLQVNGAPIRFVVDTGATSVVLRQDDARAAGIDLQGLAYVGQARTANGMVRTAPVRLDSIGLPGVEERGLTAFVNEGDMPESLLGMAYLQRFSRIEIAGGELVLSR